MSSLARGGVVPIEVARRLHAERDQALAQLERARSLLSVAKARVEELEAAHEAATAELGDLHASQPDDARVQELLGDLANLRRRREIDVAAVVRAEQLRLLGRLAEVRDTVHWALAAGPDPSSPWHAGLTGIREQIDQQLRAEGASVFGASGEVFDPRVHEAVGSVTGASPGCIARVESPGVALDDGTVVRPARVWVSP